MKPKETGTPQPGGASSFPCISSQFIIDTLTWLLTIPLAGLLRMDFAAEKVLWAPLVALAGAMTFGQALLGWLLRLPRGRFSYGSFEEVRAVAHSSTILAALAAVLILVIGPPLSIPRSIVLIAHPMTIVLMLGTRYLKCLFIERGKRPDGASLSDLRSIEIEDLISRKTIDTDVEGIAGYLMGRRVLVTGAGGSIGSELARQINRFGPAELILLDRDETGLQETQISIDGNGLLDTNRIVLADIRDSERLNEIFTERQPHVVYHAAALKHLPLLEQYPHEAWLTNVLGTLNVLRAAEASGVETFVNISTDKAADPTSVLGHSKYVAEKLTAWMAEEMKDHAKYVSVRFGNVIGSRGSMLPTFTKLIERGGPITVTHPEATRYFMTIPEACQLVIQAGGIGRSGELLILDMGQPVKILDIANRMIELSGKNIDIVFTGLRVGEKLHEVLIGGSEVDERPFHPLITHAHIGGLSPVDLDRADERGPPHIEGAAQTR